MIRLIIAIILFYAFICVVELTPLIKRKQIRELLAYSTIISIAFTLSILLGLGIDLPDPSEPIRKFVFAAIGK